MKQKNISVKKTARYFLIGQQSMTVKNVWFICHGYGHLASYFLKHFQILDNGENLLVAPEGLHRFYLQGASGRVGASWMTKEEREEDIQDYIGYLNAVYREVISSLAPDVKINLLGFSQGAATVSRWLVSGNIKADNLILWAGIFPADVQSDFKFDLKTRLFFVLGDNDEYISLEELKKELNKLDEQSRPYDLIYFNGKHEINKSALLRLSEMLK